MPADDTYCEEEGINFLIFRNMDRNKIGGDTEVGKIVNLYFPLEQNEGKKVEGEGGKLVTRPRVKRKRL